MTAIPTSRMTLEEALDWAFVERDGLVSTGPTHLARHVSARTGVSFDSLEAGIHKLLRAGSLVAAKTEGGASYRRRDRSVSFV